MTNRQLQAVAWCLFVVALVGLFWPYPWGWFW